MSSTQDQYKKQKEIEQLKEKIDLISDEILNLDDEADDNKRKVLQKEVELEDTTVGSILDKLEKQKKQLDTLKATVEGRLEVAENLEAGGEEYATELLTKRESKLDEEIESLKEEIAAKSKLLKPFQTE